MALLKKQIQPLLDKAHDIALKELERMARKAMREHPELTEFVMGMGIATFTDKNDNNIDCNERSYLKPLDDFFYEWDDKLGLTGTPMRFTADGPIETEW